MTHEGPAIVFDTIEDLKARIDDPDLDVTPDTVLVLRNCGPKGYPGMAEVANIPIPWKLLAQGVRDMVRISDARLSSTAYGTVVTHVAPADTAGDPITMVPTGDRIGLDVPGLALPDSDDAQEMNASSGCRDTHAHPEDRGCGT